MKGQGKLWNHFLYLNFIVWLQIHNTFYNFWDRGKLEYQHTEGGWGLKKSRNQQNPDFKELKGSNQLWRTGAELEFRRGGGIDLGFVEDEVHIIEGVPF